MSTKAKKESVCRKSVRTKPKTEGVRVRRKSVKAAEADDRMKR